MKTPMKGTLMFKTHKNITHTAVCVYDAAKAKKAKLAKQNKQLAIHATALAAAATAIVVANVMLNKDEN